MKRVLVTGATGFIGRHLLSPLVDKGWDVHGAGWPVTPEITEAFGSTVHLHETNLMNPDELTGLMEAVKPDSLVHMAWYAVPGKFWTAGENLDWVAASLNLVRTFAAHGGRRAVFAGTCAEYDWQQPLLKEDDEPVPATLYGTAKDALRRIVEKSAAQLDIGWAWGRIFFLYGPHEPPSRLISDVIGNLLQGSPAKCSHGRQIRDFMHVEDVAGAFINVLESDMEGVVNIASGRSRPIRDVVTLIGQLTGKPELIALGARPAAANDPPELTADVARLRDEAGFKPFWDLEPGLRQTIDWWRENR